MHFLISNKDKTLTEVCEILAKPGVYEDILPPFLSLLCLLKGGFLHKNRIHGALRNKMSPSAVECKMHISFASKAHLDEESVCDRASKKFQDMKKRRK